jgi:hypothetical protein
MALDPTELAQIVSAVLTAMRTASPQAPASKPVFLPKGSKAAPSDLAANDAKLVAAFARKGFRVTLMDRTDPAKPYDVRPFKGWLEQGRIVRKGSKGIRGLFHVTQTDPLPGKAPAKPTITTEQKEVFAKAKAAFKAKKAKPQPTPAH